MAQRRKNGIISLDTSSRRTGWAYFVRDTLKDCGIIETKSKDKMAAKLSDFKQQLTEVYKKYNPSYVIIENGYYLRNAVTLKVLSYFVAVARQTAHELLGVEADMVTTTQVRNYFGAKGKKGKEEIFKLMKKHFDLKRFTFKKHNDVTDSVAQGLYYYRKELKGEEWPEEKLINPRKTKKKAKKKPKKGK
jgi:Holliday junction resolvasome RuvABC endonuclease subunit